MSTTQIPGCPGLRTNADIISQEQSTLTYGCPTPGEILDGYRVLTCINGTWDRPVPLCRAMGGLSEWDITLIFGIVGGVAGLVSLCIFIGLIYMACYKKDRRNLYKNDIMAMNTRNGGIPLEDDIYYPPSHANLGSSAAVNGGYVHDRSLPPGNVIPLTSTVQATVYDPETMSKRSMAWQYRLDGSQMSIPRPAMGRGQLYAAGESSTDWEYGTHPTLTYTEAGRSREQGQYRM